MRTSFRTPRSYASARALVTGGCSGLGLELTRLLAADGARLLVVDRHGGPPDGVLPDGVAYRQLDVRSDEQWDEARRWVERTWGGLDLLVCNAGVAAGGRIDVLSLDDWKWIIDINLLGVVRGARTFVPLMKQARGGHLVNTASLAGLVHAPTMSSYNAVKAGVVAVSETLRHELAPWHIDVSVICPSFFRTNLAESFQSKDVEVEASAVHLIANAPRSAQQVARAAYAGMRRRRFLILTDVDGHVAYGAKRYLHPLYERAMKATGRRVARGRKATPSAFDALERLTRR